MFQYLTSLKIAKGFFSKCLDYMCCFSNLLILYISSEEWRTVYPFPLRKRNGKLVSYAYISCLPSGICKPKSPSFFIEGDGGRFFIVWGFFVCFWCFWCWLVGWVFLVLTLPKSLCSLSHFWCVV